MATTAKSNVLRMDFSYPRSESHIFRAKQKFTPRTGASDRVQNLSMVCAAYSTSARSRAGRLS
jgi:hypothetical protein